MYDTPLYKRPWFYIAGWLAFLLVVYGWQIYRMGGVEASIFDILLDLACLFPLLLVLWMAFFAQFVLPVRTFRDRQRIFDRLITYLFGGHGPAIFIRNGELIKREGEERKKGPGVLWLDTASGAVTHTAVAIKQTLGPGVHFIEKGEYVTGTVDLHTQSQTIGPKDSDKPFEDKKEVQSYEEYAQIQDRRKQVTAWTRDGIEIVPNISVTFRVATGFPDATKPGSRFGYRTGITKRDGENEKKDKEAIRRAILGQGINPNVVSDSPRHRVAWNQLPALLAVDVWREYVSKFTLDELFKPEQLVPLTLPPSPQPTEDEIDPLSQPIQVGAKRDSMQDGLINIVREINILLYRTIRILEEGKETTVRKPVPLPETSTTRSTDKLEPEKKTALQVINEMVRARLAQPVVDILDEHGIRTHGTMQSPEFGFLQDRGLAISNVNISNIRFSDAIEKQIISQWKASWLNNAKAEEERINRQIGLAEIIGQEKAELKYANALARHIMKQRPKGEKETLQALLMQTRLFVIRDDHLRRRSNTEREEIEYILQWMENGL